MQPLQGYHPGRLQKMEPQPERLMSVAVLARRLGKLATAQSQTLSEVYAFARHGCLWRHQ